MRPDRLHFDSSTACTRVERAELEWSAARSDLTWRKFNLRPPQPRYNCTLDVKVVLDYLRTLVPNDSISFENLTLKLVMLIALISGRRSHTIAHIITQDSTVSNSSVSCYIKQLIKNSKPGRPAPVIQLPAYPEDERICVLQTLREYLKKDIALST